MKRIRKKRIGPFDHFENDWMFVWEHKKQKTKKWSGVGMEGWLKLTGSKKIVRGCFDNNYFLRWSRNNKENKNKITFKLLVKY